MTSRLVEDFVTSVKKPFCKNDNIIGMEGNLRQILCLFTLKNALLYEMM